jgi:hypothetical protein
MGPRFRGDDGGSGDDGRELARIIVTLPAAA